MSGLRVMGLQGAMGLTTTNQVGIVLSLLLERIMPQGHYPRPTAVERFWKRVEKQDSEPDTCWLWTGPLDADGYGHHNEHRKNVPAHRFSYENFVGPIPEGKLVRHKCNNPPCIRPEHLELGTQKENIEDAVALGRHVHGETHGMVKITEATAKLVKSLLASGKKIKDVSSELNVGFYTVADISRGKTWKHV